MNITTHRLNLSLSRLDQSNITLALCLFIVASSLLLGNQLSFHYTTVNYLPNHAGSTFLLLCLLTLGSSIHWGRTAHLTVSLYFLCQFYVVLLLIAYLTNAVQTTPFAPIDPWLLKLDRQLGYSTLGVLAFIKAAPILDHALSFAYACMAPELALVPCLLALQREFETLKRLYFMLLTTALIGFLGYYFWPTTAPASVLHSPLFSPEQQATGLKFYALHQRQPIYSTAGGLIAMPSFHIIWACLCQYAVNRLPYIRYILGLLNLLLIAACIGLGWHYAVDLFGSLLTLLLGYLLLRAVLKAPLK